MTRRGGDFKTPRRATAMKAARARRRLAAESLLLEHDLFRKPVSTFRDHALRAAITALLVQRGDVEQDLARHEPRQGRHQLVGGAGNDHPAALLEPAVALPSHA